MKYKVGDKVRVHSLDWFKNNCQMNKFGYFYVNFPYGKMFNPRMYEFCNKVVTIKLINFDNNTYKINEIDVKDIFDCTRNHDFQDWMFESMNNNTNTISNSNIVEDFAKLIGVELDEEFYAKDSGCRYKFTANSGLMIYDDAMEDWRVAAFSLTIVFKMIKEGKFIKKWTPKDGARVYFPLVVSDSLYDEAIYYKGNAFDEEMLKKGLYFKTQEEAIECAKKMIKQVKEG